jgi:hypothetical protein
MLFRNISKALFAMKIVQAPKGSKERISKHLFEEGTLRIPNFKVLCMSCIKLTQKTRRAEISAF